MELLNEIKGVKQSSDGVQKRWFHSSDMSLVVWQRADQIEEFQLLYDSAKNEKAVTWSSNQGFRHDHVDSGEHRPGRYKQSPVLIAGGEFEAARVISQFRQLSLELDVYVAEFVVSKLNGYQ